jgi:hypothetical protein
MLGRLAPLDTGVISDTMNDMSTIDELIEKVRENPGNVRFADACKLADAFFGEPRQKGTSHRVWKMPWAGNPRVNLQTDKGGKAKAYQVRQLLDAIDRRRTEKDKKNVER